MPIRIPVQADFNGDDVERQLQQFQQKLNAIGQQIAQANKVQFNPISKTTVQDLQKVNQQFEALKRVSGDLNRRVKATGQKGSSFLDLDWSAMYPDANSRARQMSKAFQYVTGGTGIHAPAGPPQQPGGGSRPQGPSWQQAGAGAMQAGLRGLNGVTGGAGGVAAGAVGTGMSAGFGAGLAGLMGGMLALGVSKIVGAATEKIGQAEDNSVAYDRLKRTLGDVNVSFNGLRSAVEGAASNVKITFDESAKLGAQFAKLGNLSGDRYESLESEIRTGVGMSRSLGLDPSQGMGFLGTMRGMRQTQDEQGSRRMALLVGETIAKSNAFAKSDEVMEALSNYVTTQTRASHSANVGGYAGMFSSMVGSGIPGLDPMGAASMLAKINSSLSAGGAKGEASQFFTAMVGARLGLDPIQTQVLREGGAFATNSKMFGPGSVAAGFGLSGPSGDETYLESTLALVREKYGHNKGLMAMAAGNHLGIGIGSAMALLQMKPGQIGDIEGLLGKAGVSINDINMGGLSSLAKVVSGSSAERLGVASELWSRTGKDALSKKESDDLDRVMKEGTEQEQKELLTRLVAARDQEMTQGKDIRDSKNTLDNIKTLMANQLLPLTQSMRDGIMWMAGGKDGMSPRQIRENIAKAEINDEYGRKIGLQEKRAKDAVRSLSEGSRYDGSYPERYRNSMDEQIAARQEIRRLEQERDQKIGARIEELNSSPEAESAPVPHDVPDGWRAPGGAAGVGAGTESLFDAVLQQESGGRHTVGGDLITSPAGARGISQVMPATGVNPGFGVAPLQDESEAEYRRFGNDYLNAMLRRYGGDRAKALAAYNAGPGRVDSAIAQHGNDWLSAMPPETRNYVPGVMGRMSGTPMPEDAAAAAARASDRSQVDVHFGQAEIVVRNEQGQPIAPPVQMNPHIGRVGQPFVAH